MMRRRLRVSQETLMRQGHHARDGIATRACSSKLKVPPATLNTGTPRQLALQLLVQSLMLPTDIVKCRVS